LFHRFDVHVSAITVTEAAVAVKRQGASGSNSAAAGPGASNSVLRTFGGIKVRLLFEPKLAVYIAERQWHGI
jgi:hypothetical protein